VLDLLATPVGNLLNLIHEGLSTFLISSSGPAWALSIVLLTVVVRLLLFPLFVKQIKSQRRMQQLAPKVQELKAKHKGDRETMNTEMMKLYKDNGANPISGCLPLLLQLPVFFALFTVIREFKTSYRGQAEGAYGLSADQLADGAAAKVFGAPISAVFTSSADLLDDLGATPLTVRIVAALMVVGMGATTFWTQRQMIARSGTTDPQQVMVQKLLLYVLPLSFAVSGVFFPIGVLLYWLTTNVWSMGQQAYVIKRMPPPVFDGAADKGKPGTGGKPGKGPKGGGDKPDKGPKGGGDKPGKGGTDGGTEGTEGPGADGNQGPTVAVPAAAGSSTGGGGRAATAVASPSGPRPVAKRQSGSRKNKKRSRGGRR
jgi:YidC/Oxa1 family membrane protein insertase